MSVGGKGIGTEKKGKSPIKRAANEAASQM